MDPEDGHVIIGTDVEDQDTPYSSTASLEGTLPYHLRVIHYLMLRVSYICGT